MASTYLIEEHDRTGVVYGLHDGSGDIKYVGKTTRLKARMTEHLIHSRDGKVMNLALAEWIMSIEVLHVTILEDSIPAAALDATERFHILRFGLESLFNKTTSAARVERRVYKGKKRGRHLFNEAEVATIRARAARGETRVSIARELGVHRDTICQIVSGRTYIS